MFTILMTGWMTSAIGLAAGWAVRGRRRQRQRRRTLHQMLRTPRARRHRPPVARQRGRTRHRFGRRNRAGLSKRPLQRMRGG